MKTFVRLLSILAVLGFTACDYIDDPIAEGGIGPIDSVAVRKVLIEDFTGHKCPNCPLAQEEIVDLKENYFGDQMIAVSIHAGFFASTSPGYTYDFTTPEGDALNSFFGVQAYPNGMVNRTGYLTGEHLSAYDEWRTKVNVLLQEDPDMDIDISPTYNSSDHSIDVDVDVEVLSVMDDEFHLVIYLIEDGIQQPQKGPGGAEYPDYIHDHVLRASMNSAWGELLVNGPVAPSEIYSKSYSMALDSEWDEQNMHLVAFVYRNSDLEIIQVDEAKLK